MKYESNVNTSNHILVNRCCIVVDPTTLNQWAKIEQNWKQPAFQFHTSKATEPVRHRYRDSNRIPIKEIQCHAKSTFEWLETSDLSHEELECRIKTLLAVCKFRTPERRWALAVYPIQSCARQSEPIDRLWVPQRKDLFRQPNHTRWERPRLPRLNNNQSNHNYFDSGCGGNPKVYRPLLPDIEFQTFKNDYGNRNQFIWMFAKLVGKEWFDSTDMVQCLNKPLIVEHLKTINYPPIAGDAFDREYDKRRHIVNAQFKLIWYAPKNENRELCGAACYVANLCSMP